MNNIGLLLLPSILAIIVLPWIANRKGAAYLSALLATLGFVIAAYFSYRMYHNSQPLFFAYHWLIYDKLSAFFILLNAFIGMTTSYYAISYLLNEDITHLHPLIYRFYHTGYHLFILSMLVVLLSNNIGIMWIAMELATISSVVLVGLYQTPQALEAAWKYLILCGVGIGFALLGTVILYFGASTQHLGSEGLLWTNLIKITPLIPPKLLAISFVFLFVGYGTKVGFVPLHNWLPDAHAEGPAPISALLSGLLLNVALFALLRFKWMLSDTSIHYLPSILLITFGFIGVLFAALSLFRQRQLKRLFAYSSIEHLGLISIAFGIGSPLALFAGLLHVLMHSLSKTAAFFMCGNVMQTTHTQTISKIRGLFQQTPLTAILLLISILAIMGLPPSGLFVSELLLILATLKFNLWLLIPLVLGLVLAFLAILLKCQPLFFSNTTQTPLPLQTRSNRYWPAALHLLLVILAGIFVPAFLIAPVVHTVAGVL